MAPCRNNRKSDRMHPSSPAPLLRRHERTGVRHRDIVREDHDRVALVEDGALVLHLTVMLVHAIAVQLARQNLPEIPTKLERARAVRPGTRVSHSHCHAQIQVPSWVGRTWQ
jgi:hypothetical protein